MVRSARLLAVLTLMGGAVLVAAASNASAGSAPTEVACVPLSGSSTTQIPTVNGAPIETSVATPATVDSFDDGSLIQRIPPREWSPLTATTAELKYYGFPSRPSNASDMSTWKAQWANYSGEVAQSPCVDANERQDTNGAPWAGLVDYGGSNDYTQAYARMPQPYIGAGCQSQQYYSTWVGLGGDTAHGSYDLIQGGTIDNGNGNGTYVPPGGYRGPDGNVANFTETFDNGSTPGIDWYSPGFVSRGDALSLTVTYFPPIPVGSAYVEYYWHDGTTGKVVSFDQYTADHKSISASFDGSSADFVNELSAGWDNAPAADQQWSYATATNSGTTSDVGVWPHDDYYAQGWSSGAKALGLAPPYLQSNSSWTMHHYQCN